MEKTIDSYGGSIEIFSEGTATSRHEAARRGGWMTVTRRGKRFPSCTPQIGEDLQQGVDAGCSDSAWEDKLKKAR